MTPSEPPQAESASESWEFARIVVLLLATAAAFVGLQLLSMYLVRHVSPWLGVVVWVGAFFVWRKLAPRPYRVLLHGCVTLGGFVFILAGFVDSTVVLVRWLLA